MLPQNCGQLLFNAVRETLETMAFAEVIPCSLKVGNEDISQQSDDFDSNTTLSAGEGSGWGDDTSSSMPAPAPEDPWGPPSEGATWGNGAMPLPANDPWGDTKVLDTQAETVRMEPEQIDFDYLVATQEDWCWARMSVNSPDINSVWFIVSKGLANALAQNMYAGEEFQLENSIVRDIVAELTNVLGGRLMILLEEMGGQFTLTVPELGFGMPQFDDSQVLETVMCKVVVDGEYPVLAALCFNASQTTS
ncbi:MAG: hypothetical protein ACRCUY_01855 [Thermoguttaceae bacterium]